MDSKVKVKIIVSISGVRYDFTQGQEVEVDETIAQELIGAGVAEMITSFPSPNTETKTASTTRTTAKKKK